jgi:hypothetical protein
MFYHPPSPTYLWVRRACRRGHQSLVSAAMSIACGLGDSQWSRHRANADQGSTTMFTSGKTRTARAAINDSQGPTDPTALDE